MDADVDRASQKRQQALGLGRRDAQALAQQAARFVQGGLAGKKRTVRSGDTLPLAGVSLTFVSSHADVLAAPLPGAAGGANPHCTGAETRAAIPGNENSRSVGFVLSIGIFQFLNVGDLLWAEEHALACPVNKVGKIDLYQVTHHGQAESGAPQLVRAIEALASVMNNGPRKGGAAVTFDRLAAAAGGLADVWQLHRAVGNNAAPNGPAEQTANLAEGSGDQGIS